MKNTNVKLYSTTTYTDFIKVTLQIKNATRCKSAPKTFLPRPSRKHEPPPHCLALCALGICSAPEICPATPGGQHRHHSHRQTAGAATDEQPRRMIRSRSRTARERDGRPSVFRGTQIANFAPIMKPDF